MPPMDSPSPVRRVLVVDDHPLYRDALAEALLRHHPGLAVDGAGGLAEARAAGIRLGPFALVVADQQLPDGQGLDLLLDWPWPETARVLLSGSSEPSLAARARRAGLQAFLPKSMPPTRMVVALTSVLDGQSWFEAEAAIAPVLTERQLAVLQRAAQGQSNREIGAALGVSERTVKDHMTLIFQRLDAGTRAEAVARAAASGLLQLPRPPGGG